jgi:hypothetical protein
LPQFLKPRTRSLPLDGARILQAAFELAREVAAETAAGAVDFDRSLERVEHAVKRCRAAFLAQDHHEADAALAYHDRASAELAGEFVPLYYRKAVLDNVLARYERAGRALVRTSA